jgi:hypothetical protein
MHKFDSAARHSVAPTASKIHVKREKGVKKIKCFFQRPAVSVVSVRSWWRGWVVGLGREYRGCREWATDHKCSSCDSRWWRKIVGGVCLGLIGFWRLW